MLDPSGRVLGGRADDVLPDEDAHDPVFVCGAARVRPFAVTPGVLHCKFRRSVDVPAMIGGLVYVRASPRNHTRASDGAAN